MQRPSGRTAAQRVRNCSSAPSNSDVSYHHSNLHGATRDLSKLCHFVEGNTYRWCLLVRACRQHSRRDLAGLPQALGILKFRTRSIPAQYLPAGLQHRGPHSTCKHMAYIFPILREGDQPLKLCLGPWSLSLAAPGEYILKELV